MRCRLQKLKRLYLILSNTIKTLSSLIDLVKKNSRGHIDLFFVVG